MIEIENIHLSLQVFYQKMNTILLTHQKINLY